MEGYLEQMKSWWKHMLILVSGIMLAAIVLYSTTIELKAEEVARGTCGDNLTWVITNNNDSFNFYNYDEGKMDTCGECYTLTISGTGAMEDYNYSYDEDSDKWISEEPQPWKDFRWNITQIELGEGITSIGNYAFMWTDHLISADLPESLISIGDYAFQGCCYGEGEGEDWHVIGGLPAITIPGTVIKIGNDAFRDNWNLGTVNYKGKDLVAICPNGTYDDGNEWSERDRVDCAFGCTPWFVAWEEEWNYNRMHGTCGANGGDNLIWEVSENDDVFKFYNYDEEEMQTSDDGYTLIISGTGVMQDYGIYYDEEQGKEIHEPMRPWEEFRFNITQVVVEEGVTSIGNCAFKWIDHLRKVTLPKGLTSIGYDAFFECINEKPGEPGEDNIIMDYLSEIEIPKSVTEIGKGTFAGYRDNTVTIKGVPGSAAEKYVINEKNDFEVLQFVDACAAGHRGGKASCHHQAVCDFCEKAYGSFDSANHESLQAVAARAATSTAAGNTAYWYCKACGRYFSDANGRNEITLASTVIPATGNGTVDKTLAIGTVIFDKKTKSYYKVTSSGASGNAVEYIKPTDTSTSITIPAAITINGVSYKVTAIAKNAFKGNKKIKKIIIGTNVITIGSNAFKGCKKLKTITIKTKKLTSKSVAKNAFKGLTTITTIKVPKNKLTAYKKLLKNKGLSSKIKVK